MLQLKKITWNIPKTSPSHSKRDSGIFGQVISEILSKTLDAGCRGKGEEVKVLGKFLGT